MVGADGRTVCERCAVADRPFARMRGLLGRRELAPGEGLLLRPAGSIHTAFMRFSIDAVFLDRDLTVLGIERELPAWRTARRRGARSILELPAGASDRNGIAAGEPLALVWPV